MAKIPFAKLNKLHACEEAEAWLRLRPDDWHRAWSDCERGDWMLWLLGKLCLRSGDPWGKPEHRRLVGCMVEIVLSLAQPLWREADREILDGVARVLDRYSRGEDVQREVVREAWQANAAYADAAAAYADAAYADAAYAAYAYAAAAYAAAAYADAAAAAYAYAAAANDAAYAAADAAAYAAAYAAANDAADAADDARRQSLAASADIVRSWYPEPPEL